MKIEVTEEMVATLDWIGGRYGWADSFPCHEAGMHEVEEHEMWAWKEAVDEEDSLFSCLEMDSDAGRRFLSLYEAII